MVSVEETQMYIHDDANIDAVVATATKAILEGARKISKLDRNFTNEQISQLETAIRELQNAIALKKG